MSNYDQQIINLDIETGPIPEEELVPMLPAFKPPGNIKDPFKIAEREKEHYAEARERAALDPLTGRVVAVGLKIVGEGAVRIIGHDDEKQTLIETFAILNSGEVRNPVVVGFNTHSFDLGFLWRRAWKHRVIPPAWMRNGRYWSSQSIDLREVWQLGNREVHGSLDAICKHLGLAGKNGNGKDFAALWHTDRQKAIEYLTNDLNMVDEVRKILCP